MTSIKTRCPSCHAMNRVPTERLSESSVCGKCKQFLLDGLPVEGTVDNFQSILNSDIPVVVDFWAPWCNPCVGFAPIFEQTAQERVQRVRFIKVDTEAQQALAAQYQIRSIPTVMVFHRGQRLNMINGALPYSQFNAWLDESLKDL
ncbi:thioredoxin TrxC [Vibrio rhizosphaerae]|uniref:Thioredoxin n=1 Tax=Vibrio rhizosphaerae TaxID=398736 RepID=A0ABU4IZ41_9VIBR|nr:thioredoxin TrxC [Vibrio rhizosphaerae]MDW6094680.1 thioredoxin TrxC [Vibrio rhizosphaerae]